MFDPVRLRCCTVYIEMYTLRTLCTIMLACIALSRPCSALLNPALDDFSLLNSGGFLPPQHHASTLSKRDYCSTNFPGTINQYCTPGKTYCCSYIRPYEAHVRMFIRLGVSNNTATAYPQCQKHFGVGFCCVEENGNCYIDITSDCTTPGAVRCGKSV